MFDIGITPACAGTTLIGRLAMPIYGDHPRMCGDHNFHSGHVLVILGSPPHVRGPLIIMTKEQLDFGITPACAGTTLPRSPLHIPFGDHPRMCGDHSTVAPFSSTMKDHPACAGTTSHYWVDP